MYAGSLTGIRGTSSSPVAASRMASRPLNDSGTTARPIAAEAAPAKLDPNPRATGEAALLSSASSVAWAPARGVF